MILWRPGRAEDFHGEREDISELDHAGDEPLCVWGGAGWVRGGESHYVGPGRRPEHAPRGGGRVVLGAQVGETDEFCVQKRGIMCSQTRNCVLKMMKNDEK